MGVQQNPGRQDHDGLPDYDDLPPAPLGGRTAWGMFGADDQAGLVNLITPERVVAAAALVRKGAVFPLNAPVGAFDPAIASHRGVPRHRVLHTEGSIAFDDVYDNFYPQASSQWDSARAHRVRPGPVLQQGHRGRSGSGRAEYHRALVPPRHRRPGRPARHVPNGRR